MKKLFYIVLLLGSTYVFSQNKGMTYQAVIYAPGGQNVPGVNVSNIPMTNRTICLQFSFLDATSNVEYEEVVKTTTDEFGMVNITIGSGNQTGGYASSFAAIIWTATTDKSLKVSLDATGLCNQFDELSTEKLASVPFANAALTAGNVSGVVAIANGGTGATTATAARTNLGLGNVDNTTDLNKPMSIATKTYVDSQITSSTIPDATASNKGKIQLAGDLGGTAEVPTVPGLALKAPLASPTFTGTVSGITKSMVGLGNVDNTTDANKPVSTATQTALDLKENLSNKSTNITADAASTTKYPAVKTIKDYVDTAIAGATIADATATNKGKIQLAGDLGGTAAAPTVPGLALKANATDVTTSLATKENTANKSTDTTLASNSDVKFPTEKAVKTYVDTAIAGATIADATATNKGKIQLAGDLGGTAAAPTVPALATKENTANKSTATVLGTSDVLFPTQNAVKTYVDTNITAVNNANSALQATVTANATAATNAIAAVQADVDANEATSVAADTALQNNITTLQNTVATNATNTTAALALKEDAANKSTVTTLGTSDVLFPTQNAVKTYVDAQVASATIADADAVTKGKIQLAGDLSGTAASPEIAAGAVTTTKIADANVTYAKIQNVSATDKVLGRVSNGAGPIEEIATTGNGDVVRANSPTLITPDLGTPSAVVLTNATDLPLTSAVIGVLPVANGGTGSATQNFVDLTTNQSIAGSKSFDSDITANGVKVGKGNGNGDSNVAVGTNLGTGTGYRNTGVGAGALQNFSGTSFGNNTGVGYANMQGLTTGYGNTSLGGETLASVATSDNNTAIGNQTLRNAVTSNNTAIGANAGNGVISGANNTFLGSQADTNSGTISNATAIGQGAIVSASNTVQIGNSSVTSVKTDGIVTSNGYVKTGGTASQFLKADGSVDSNSYLYGTVLLTNGGTGATTAADALTNLGAQATANLSTDITTDGASTTKYPAVKTIKDYVDTQIASGVVDASTTVKGKIQLAGDLAGTAASPEVATGAITTAKLADNAVETAKIKDANVTDAKLDKTNIPLSGFGAATADVDLGSNKLTNVTDPTAAQDAATKNYVDTATSSITTLTDGKIYVGNASNEATQVTPSGDVTITNAGVTAIGTGKVVTAMLATDAVETAKIKNANVTTAKLADNAVETAKIKDANVTTAKLADNAVEEAKIKDANVTTNKLAANAVTSAKILDGTIVVGDLADDAVETAKIKDANVTPAKLEAGNNNTVLVTDGSGVVAWLDATAFGAVADMTTIEGAGTTASPFVVKDLGIVTAKLAPNAVTSAKILDGTIVVGDLANDAVETAKIKDANVTTAKLADNAVEEAKIKDANVTTNKLAANAVTSAKILDGTIVVGDLADDAVETAKIKDANVTTNKLAANAVTSAKILDGTIVVGDIADDAVETAKIKDANVTDAKLDKANIPLSGFGAATANVALGSNKLTGVANPTAAQDAATKSYVDTATSAITTLADGNIYIGNGSNEATAVAVSGDVTIDNTGVTTIGAGKVITTMLANNAVTTAKITDANVTTAKLADNAVEEAKIKDANVTTAKLAADAVTSAKILDGTIVVGDLADNAIETAKIKDNAVTSAKIKDGEIVNADISASAAIVDTKLATIATSGKVSNSATTATDANTASAIVARDANGDFSAGTITADLSGNATTATTATHLAGGASGSMPYQTAAGTTTMLAKGTDGQVLVLASGVPKWSNNIGGGVLSKTDSYDILATDSANLLVFSGSAASKTIKLPSAVTVGAGREITIKNIASVSVSIAATAGKLISDSTTTTATSLTIGIEPSNNWIKAISDGTNWIILRALF